MLRENESPALTDSSMWQEVTKHEQWERSNRLSLILMQSHVNKSIKGFIPRCTKIKEFIKVVEEQFVSFNKALASTMMKRFLSKTFDSYKGVCGHIMEMRDMTAHIKS